MKSALKLGTRGSQLAIWQAQMVADQLKDVCPGLSVEIRIIKTTGDKILDVALSRIGDKGIFSKEIESETIPYPEVNITIAELVNRLKEFHINCDFIKIKQ